MLDFCCNRRFVILRDDVYIRMFWLVDLFINRYIGIYFLFNKRLLIYCKLI